MSKDIIIVVPDNPYSPEEIAAQPYVARINRFMEGRKGGLWDVNIKHDDDCPLINETGLCNCNPDIDYVLRKA